MSRVPGVSGIPNRVRKKVLISKPNLFYFVFISIFTLYYFYCYATTKEDLPKILESTKNILR